MTGIVSLLAIFLHCFANEDWLKPRVEAEVAGRELDFGRFAKLGTECRCPSRRRFCERSLSVFCGERPMLGKAWQTLRGFLFWWDSLTSSVCFHVVCFHVRSLLHCIPLPPYQARKVKQLAKDLATPLHLYRWRSFFENGPSIDICHRIISSLSSTLLSGVNFVSYLSANLSPSYQWDSMGCDNDSSGRQLSPCR